MSRNRLISRLWSRKIRAGLQTDFWQHWMWPKKCDAIVSLFRPLPTTSDILALGGRDGLRANRAGMAPPICVAPQFARI